MNKYDFDDIEIGHEESFVYEINKEKMDQFLSITNDINPLHNNLDYAKSKGYEEKVVYGMLSASGLSTLAGVYLPGEKSLIHSVEIKFIKPVFLSTCPLTITGKVVNKDERFLTIEVKFNITNILKEKVARGNMQIGIMK